jgi:hypothetical protein
MAREFAEFLSLKWGRSLQTALNCGMIIRLRRIISRKLYACS